MGDQKGSSTRSDRNLTTPAAMSGIDWSIFKDGEEDAFGWLLRNNVTSFLMSDDAADVKTNDILLCNDVKIDCTIGKSAVDGRSHFSEISKASAVIAANEAHSNARLPVMQLEENLRYLPPQSVANLVSLLQTRHQLHDRSCSAEVSSKHHDDENTAEMGKKLTITSKAEKMDRSVSVVQNAGQKASIRTRSISAKRSAEQLFIADSSRPFKQKKSGADGSITEVDCEKKQLRRVKNLVSVREFRKRKTKQLEQNEARLRRLEAENLDLKMRLKIGKEAILGEQREKQQIKDQMREMLQRNANEQEIAQFLNMYKVTYSDYGPNRREKLHFHLSRIRELLLPTQVTKLSLYSVEQGVDMLRRDHTIKDDLMSAPGCDSSTTSLWGILASDLDLTAEQQRQILKHRVAIKKVRDDLNHTLSIVKKLEEVTNEKNTALEAQVAELQQILTPSQATKFIIWVKENPAVMYMLDKLVDSTLQKNTCCR
ncbi:hypothetical protein CCR75_005356 [Bremia lactucae]|uniref:BZIP domain-containing protein n=1 Tax=Bremia lactucae TaxID=4779 RepID=A0A976ID62_BRELC|nr:hypothetical protein CCR75_005356 [Bremia lactucae]